MNHFSYDIDSFISDYEKEISPEQLKKLKEMQVRSEKDVEYQQITKNIMEVGERLIMGLISSVQLGHRNIGQQNKMLFVRHKDLYRQLIFSMSSKTHNTGLDDVTEPYLLNPLGVGFEPTKPRYTVNVIISHTQ